MLGYLASHIFKNKLIPLSLTIHKRRLKWDDIRDEYINYVEENIGRPLRDIESSCIFNNSVPLAKQKKKIKKQQMEFYQTKKRFPTKEASTFLLIHLIDL